MANINHKDVGVANGVHINYAFSAASQSAREALSLSTSDVGKVVRQTDNESYWWITGTGPNTFARADMADALQADGSVTLDADLEVTNSAVLNDALAPGWGGVLIDEPDVSVASDGATITLSIEKSGTGDILCRFDNETFTLDCTPIATVSLTAGTDTTPTTNYVYLTESGGTVTLAKSTSGWPASPTKYCAIATVLCQSASSLQTDGAYKMHLWADHLGDEQQGHVSHLSRWIRSQRATWISGCDPADLSVSSPDAYISTASGEVLQLHPHTMPARDMSSGDPAYVVNDPTTAYKRITTLDDITQDSAGGAINNKHFTLVLWGCVSEDAADCKLFINLPGGTYSNSSAAIADADGYTNYTIPDEFSGCGFLIAAYTVEGKDSGAWVQNDKADLRGLVPSTSAGGSGGGGGGGSGDATSIQTVPVDAAAPTDAQIFIYDGSVDNEWEPKSLSGGFTITRDGVATVTQVNGLNIGTGTPTAGDMYVWSGSAMDPVTMSGDISVAGTGVVTISAISGDVTSDGRISFAFGSGGALKLPQGAAASPASGDIKADGGRIEVYQSGAWSEVAIIKNNLTATTAPTSGDDNTDDYQQGSRWMDRVADKYYICVDASTGAAQWRLLGSVYHGGSCTDRITFSGDGAFKLPSAAATSPSADDLRRNSTTDVIERYDGSSWVRAVKRQYTIKAASRLGISDGNWTGNSGIYPIEQDGAWEHSWGAANIYTTPIDPSGANLTNSRFGIVVPRAGVITSVTMMFDNLDVTSPITELWFTLVNISHNHGGDASATISSKFPVGKQLCLDNTTDGLDITKREFFVSTDTNGGRELTLGTGTDVEVAIGDSLTPLFAIDYNASGSLSNTCGVCVIITIEEA